MLFDIKKKYFLFCFEKTIEKLYKLIQWIFCPKFKVYYFISLRIFKIHTRYFFQNIFGIKSKTYILF